MFICLIVGIIAGMLLLVKCYDKKGVVTLQLGHPSFDLASGGYPTKKILQIFQVLSLFYVLLSLHEHVKFHNN